MNLRISKSGELALSRRTWNPWVAQHPDPQNSNQGAKRALGSRLAEGLVLVHGACHFHQSKQILLRRQIGSRSYKDEAIRIHMEEETTHAHLELRNDAIERKKTVEGNCGTRGSQFLSV